MRRSNIIRWLALGGFWPAIGGPPPPVEPLPLNMDDPTDVFDMMIVRATRTKKVSDTYKSSLISETISFECEMMNMLQWRAAEVLTELIRNFSGVRHNN